MNIKGRFLNRGIVIGWISIVIFSLAIFRSTKVNFLIEKILDNLIETKYNHKFLLEFIIDRFPKSVLHEVVLFVEHLRRLFCLLWGQNFLY